MKETTKTKRDPEGTKRRILDAATVEFRMGGLAGARVDCIAKRALTNERMLYYYFTSKENLFIAVLEESYSTFVSAQSELNFGDMPPTKAVVSFAHFVWDYYHRHPEMIRLINNENLHEARYLAKSRIRECMSPVLGVLEDIVTRGIRDGEFRKDVDPVRLYLSVSALGYYVVSNGWTLAKTFGRDFLSETEHRALTEQNTAMLLAYLQLGAAASTAASSSMTALASAA